MLWSKVGCGLRELVLELSQSTVGVFQCPLGLAPGASKVTGEYCETVDHCAITGLASHDF
jgi:hypothetical protein